VASTLTGALLGGRYRVGPRLGEGGMGAVYEAVQEGLDRKVALKVLHEHLASEPELRGRFEREAHVVAKLGHPNVVQISDFQTNDGEPPFLVMELLHGENLRDLLKRASWLPPERVAFIATQVLSALEAAHRANVVHRDVKPDNIFLERTSAQADIVKVLDFGVAKLLGDEEAGFRLTRQGLVVGTLAYMSPEQALGDPVDGRADVYSLAAVMYVALAGRKPFEGETTAALLQAILNAAPPPLASLRPDVGEGLSNVVARALSKRPSDRFGSAAEMARALAPYAKPTSLEPPASATPTTAPAPTVPTPPAFEPVPATVAMGPPSDRAPRTTPLPPVLPGTTQRLPPAPIARTLAMDVPVVMPRARRRAPRAAALVVAGVALLLAAAALLAAYGPWHVVMGSR
jgi:serine/threonine protein kinase